MTTPMPINSSYFEAVIPDVDPYEVDNGSYEDFGEFVDEGYDIEHGPDTINALGFEPVPALDPIHEEGFESADVSDWVEGWDSGNTITAEASTTRSHSGTYSMRVTSPNASDAYSDVALIIEDFMGDLYEGQPFTVTAWVYLVTSGSLALCTFKPEDGEATTVTGEWVQLTAHAFWWNADRYVIFRFTGTLGVPIEFYVDDITITPEGFMDGWGSSSKTSWPTTDEFHSGTQSLATYNPPDTFGFPSGVHIERTFTGFTEGRTYEISIWAKGTAGTELTLEATSTATVTDTFELTSEWTRHSISIECDSSGEIAFSIDAFGGDADEMFLDDIEIQESWTEHVEILVWHPDWTYVPNVEELTDIPLKVLRASWALDESRAPFVSVNLECALPPEAALEQIDPRTSPRTVLFTSQEWVQPERELQTRGADLILHEREIDHETQTLRLTLVSDEAMLIDAGNDTAVTDSGAEAYQTSLRDIIDYILGLQGLGPLSADPEMEDFDFTITSDAENVIINPSVETNTTGYTAVPGTSGTAAISQQANNPYQGTNVARCAWTVASTAAGGGLYYEITLANAGLSIGDVISAGIYRVRANVGNRVQFSVEFRTDAATISTTSATALQISANTNYGAASHAANFRLDNLTIPATTTRIRLRVLTVAGTGYANWANGNNIQLDALMMNEGATLLPYFDGAGSTPTDAHYSYSWLGTANASRSKRTRLDDRDPDILKIEPGETYWDFLAALVQAAGLRLFCDETRSWRLVNPLTFSIEGTIHVAAGTNVTRGTDLVSRQQDAWFDAVVVKYRWIDSTGAQQVTYDAASDGGTKVYTKEVNRPYPGPGAAALLLGWFTGRGRTLDLRALTDLDIMPGKSLIATLPGTPVQVGVVSSVTFEWSAEGDSDEMQVGSRGLIDTPATAWVLQPDDYPWDDVPVGISWDEYTTPV